MADGSRTSALEVEANAAAAEAAREAKAEVLQGAVTITSAEKLASPARGETAKAKKKPRWAEFVVDVWITSFN